MMDQPNPDLLNAIRQGLEVSGKALLDEARRSHQPLVTWAAGRVVLVDADGVEATNSKDGHARQ